MQICKTKLRLPNMDETQYGFKTKFESALVQDISDLSKSKTAATGSDFMKDRSHLDGNLTTGNLICRNLVDEAVDAQKELEGVTKELRRCQRHGTVDKSKLDAKGALSKLRKVAYNLKADLETFI